MISKAESITEEERGKSGGSRDQTLPYRLCCKLVPLCWIILSALSVTFSFETNMTK